MILTPVINMDLEETNELPDSIRGVGGFGSTGKWEKILTNLKLKDSQDN